MGQPLDSRNVIQFRAGGTSLLIDAAEAEGPRLLYWGPDLGTQSQECLASLSVSTFPQRISGGVDKGAPLTLFPQFSSGWLNRPALSGHRNGSDFSTSFNVKGIDVFCQRAVFHLVDEEAKLSLTMELGLTDVGLFFQRVQLQNVGDSDYTLDALATVFHLPESATEVLSTTGHHLRERSPQRHQLTVGTFERESRRGRPGADSTLLLAVGSNGFGFESGLVHGVHLAWSGNQRVAAELTTGDDRFLTAEELFESGEIILKPGEAYQTPPALASWGNGLNELSARYHQHVRTRPTHPRRPRPVTLNTWEAVYFDHDLEKLKELADSAARAGVERYVLDDGWFLGRRDDTAGLGDWIVDPDVWPGGLHPLVEHVKGLGMEFGLWVEPEMINPNSDLARAHPEWILSSRADLPVPARQQQVLNLANPEAYKYVRDSLTALLSEYDIAYLKWDHNRDLHGPGSGPGGRALAHEQTQALYRLLGELKEFQPGLEIESCASGGARIDLGIAEVTDRFHTSDCLDPGERLTNQKYTGLVIPPELLSAHLTTPRVHSTGRTVSTLHSGAVAMLGHFGIEWDLSVEDEETQAEVAELVRLYKANRHLVATGTVVHADLSDPALDVRGVVSTDKQEALFTVTQVSSSVFHPVGNVHFPGLEPETLYEITPALPEKVSQEPGQSPVGWMEESVTLSGAVLGSIGVRAPVQFPERSLILSVTAVQ